MVRPSVLGFQVRRWISEAGGGILHCQELDQLVHIEEDVKRLLPRSPRSVVLAFGGRTLSTSGETGPSSDILLFNPVTRFYTSDDHIIYKVIVRSWQSMDWRLPQAIAYTSAAGENDSKN